MSAIEPYLGGQAFLILVILIWGTTQFALPHSEAFFSGRFIVLLMSAFGGGLWVAARLRAGSAASIAVYPIFIASFVAIAVVAKYLVTR